MGHNTFEQYDNARKANREADRIRYKSYYEDNKEQVLRRENERRARK